MSSMLAALTKPSVTNEPPTAAELRRNDVAMWITLAFALFLGWGIANNAMNASRTTALGDGLPSIAVPARWIKGQSDDFVVYAYNPRSPSVFNTELRVAVRPLGPEETLAVARTGLGLRRSQELLRYREFSATPVTVNGEPGIVVDYAYIADPTREAGALAPPVVVEGQDLLFVRDGRLIVVTMASDTVGRDADERYYRAVYDSLNVRDVAPEEGA
jgi:hypothetical protein